MVSRSYQLRPDLGVLKWGFPAYTISRGFIGWFLKMVQLKTILSKGGSSLDPPPEPPEDGHDYALCIILWLYRLIILIYIDGCMY